MSSGSFKNVIYRLYLYKTYTFNMWLHKLSLNNLQGLIYHKIHSPNQPSLEDVSHED